MVTGFGPEAKEGDYVIVLDADYVHRSASTYIAKVHNNKAYTGMKMKHGKNFQEKYIHKLSAITTIPESYVPEETKLLIEEDIRISDSKTKKK